jgi:hypothetical protein
MAQAKVHITARVKPKTVKRMQYLAYKMKKKGDPDLNKSQLLDEMALVLERQFREGFQLQIT